ncbi:RmlC-like cupin domain-containing protein [Xylariaceae sp. FL0016]|nr:RmlC-like cupin domain-containing protein [Xylariaceae sp. FL0016]
MSSSSGQRQILGAVCRVLPGPILESSLLRHTISHHPSLISYLTTSTVTTTTIMSASTSTTIPRSVQDVIAALNLKPHPEKGWYIETFRDTAPTPSSTSLSTSLSTMNDKEDKEEGRASSTCIYYLLEGSSGLSHWHRVRDAVEIWHHYAGAPLRLSLAHDDGSPVRDVVLGSDLWLGQRPQAVVRRDEWQHAQSLGDWTLVGCTVAPAFTFASFEMAAKGWEPRGADADAPATASEDTAGVTKPCVLGGVAGTGTAAGK